MSKPTPPEDKLTPLPVSSLLDDWQEKLASARAVRMDAEGLWQARPRISTKRQPGRELHEARLEVSHAYRISVQRLRGFRRDLAALKATRDSAHGLAPSRWLAGNRLRRLEDHISQERMAIKLAVKHIDPDRLAPILQAVAKRHAEARTDCADRKRKLEAARNHEAGLITTMGKLYALERAGVAVVGLDPDAGDSGCVAAIDAAHLQAVGQRKCPSGNEASLVSRLLLSHRHWQRFASSQPDWSADAHADMVALGIVISKRSAARELLKSRYGTIWDEVVSHLPAPPPTPPKKPSIDKADRARLIRPSVQPAPIRFARHLPRP